MKPYLLCLILAITCLFSCSSDEYSFSIGGSAILRSKEVLTYDMEIFFQDPSGVEEVRDKADTINHAVRIILIQRDRSQINHKGRLISVVKKILKSQLNTPVKRIVVTVFEFEKA